MKKQVAERIRLMRLSRNLSQENVAEELGLSIGAYSNIERGVTDISITRLQQIAGLFGVAVTDIVDLDKNIFSGHVDEPSARDYGYASKEEVTELRRAIAQLENEFKKLRQELASKRK